MLMLRTEIFASVVLVGAGISNSYDLGVLCRRVSVRRCINWDRGVTKTYFLEQNTTHLGLEPRTFSLQHTLGKKFPKADALSIEPAGLS